MNSTKILVIDDEKHLYQPRKALSVKVYWYHRLNS